MVYNLAIGRHSFADGLAPGTIPALQIADPFDVEVRVRSRRSGRGDLASSLRWIVDALKAGEHRGSRSRRRGEALALQRLSRIAALEIPARGVLMPVDDDLSHAIDRATRRPLDAVRGRRMLNQSLRKVRAFATRDAIEAAHSRVAMDTARAYYYAGLAWGITFAERRCKR